MTYLIGSHSQSAAAGDRFRALLARDEILQMPGAHNGMAALQAKAAGFEALYLSGAGMSASMGNPRDIPSFKGVTEPVLIAVASDFALFALS